MEHDKLFCICQTEYNEHRFMIECFACKEWFHGDCVGILEKEAELIEEYYCRTCQAIHGTSKLKMSEIKKSYKPEEFELIEHPSIKNFYQALDDTTFLNSSHVATYLASGTSFTSDFVYEHAIQKPVVIENIEGLGLTAPPIKCSKHVESYLGPNHVLNIHDILENEERMVKLAEWTSHFDNPENLENTSIVDKIDITGTKLYRMIKTPRVLKQFDLVESSWPKPDSNEDFLFEKPKQSLFLSMGDSCSFVDFQIGMVGGAVWFYNMFGSRTIYLVPPTEENLKIYEERAKINNFDNRFFGDLANACYKLVTRENEFVIIPGGWIFSSYLNSKSISLMGEFCNVFSLPVHVQCFEVQKRLKSLNTLRYPRFEVLVWCAAEYVHMLLSSKEFQHKSNGLVDSTKSLVAILRKWISKKEEYLHAQEIPPHINPTKLINSISYSIGRITRVINPKVSPLKVKTKPSSSKRISKSHPFPIESQSPVTPQYNNVTAETETLSIKVNKSLLYSQQSDSAEANVSKVPIKLRLPKVILNEISPEVESKDQRPIIFTKSGRKRKRPKALAGFVDSGGSNTPLYESDDSISETTKVFSTCELEKPEVSKIRKRLKEDPNIQSAPSVISTPPDSPVKPIKLSRRKGNVYNEDNLDDLESRNFLSKCKQDSYYVYPTIGKTDEDSEDYSSETPIRLKVRLPKPQTSSAAPKTPLIGKNKKGLRTPKQRLGKLLKIDKTFIRR